MNLPPASAVLDERHHGFVRQQCLLRLANGPPLTAALTWRSFWDEINAALRSCGYSRSTRLQYRHVLRALRRFGIRRPADLTAGRARDYLHGIVQSGASWSWIAQNIAVLRTVFDRLCRQSVTAGMVTPKRGCRLPETISEAEAVRLIQSCVTMRDQLLLGLLYGCGLAGSEACALRWQDVLDEGRRLHVPASTRYMERVLVVPEPLRQLLWTGAQTCASDRHIFPGRGEGKPLSTRMVELIVRHAAESAGIERPVCVLTLRHSYATHRLQNGASLPELQAELGHASIRTTERYRACLAPKLESHPFTTVRRLMTKHGVPAQPPVSRPPAPVPHRPLATAQSIDLRSLRLPFAPPQPLDAAAAFLRLLKSRLFGLFLRRPDTS